MSAPSRTSVYMAHVRIFQECFAVFVMKAMSWTGPVETAQVNMLLPYSNTSTAVLHLIV